MNRLTNRSTSHPFAWLCAIMLCASLLTACTAGALSIDAKITLFQGEHWSAQTVLVYSAGEIQYLGGQIEGGLQQIVSRWEAQGIKASYSRKVERDGNTRFTLKASGQGFAKLNAALFDNLAQVSVENSGSRPVVNFSYLPVGSIFGIAPSRTFTLTGGEILSSNGVTETKNSVSWTNPADVLQARLTLAPRLDPVVLLAGAGGAVVLFAMIGLARRGRKKRCPVCGYQAVKRADFCPQCGAGFF